jgi:hypothetical protein
MELVFNEFKQDLYKLFDDPERYIFKCEYIKDIFEIVFNYNVDEADIQIPNFWEHKLYNNSNRILCGNIGEIHIKFPNFWEQKRHDGNGDCTREFNYLYFYVIPHLPNVDKINIYMIEDTLYELIRYLDLYDVIRFVHAVDIPDNIFKRLLYNNSKLNINIMEIINPNLSYMELYLGYYYYLSSSEDFLIGNINVLMCRYYCYKYDPILFKLFDKEMKCFMTNSIYEHNNDWNIIKVIMSYLSDYNKSCEYNINHLLEILCQLSETIDIKNICDYLYDIGNFNELEDYIGDYFREMYEYNKTSNILNARRIIKYLYNRNILDVETYLDHSIDDINLFMWYFGIEDKTDNYIQSVNYPKLELDVYKLLSQNHTFKYIETKCQNTVLCIKFLSEYDVDKYGQLLHYHKADSHGIKYV